MPSQFRPTNTVDIKGSIYLHFAFVGINSSTHVAPFVCMEGDNGVLYTMDIIVTSVKCIT